MKQLRLQTLVEGLSVLAAAYYLIGLILYVAKGIEAFPSGSQAEIIVGAITLPVILLIYAFVRHLRNKVLRESGEANTRIADGQEQAYSPFKRH